MKNSSLSKTLTASLPTSAQDTFARISDPDHLPEWHTSFCRSIRKDNGSLFVESPRGEVAIHFIRDDHSRVLDIVIRISEGVALTHAIRLLPNGEGSEIIWTLIKPQGLADAVFHEQLRWAGSALHNLRKTPKAEPNRTSHIENRVSQIAEEPSSAISDTRSAISDSVEPLQAPSATEVSSMPISGKKLFIGNLPYDWTDDQLRAHFVEQGTIVLAEIARFRGRGGRSRGFGFVEMSTEIEAQSAVEKLHGSTAGGRQVVVRIAKSQEARPPQEPRNAAPEAQSASAENPIEDSDKPEPGNERIPPSPTPRPRHERPRRGGMGRPRDRGAAPRASRPPSGNSRSYQDQDISNKSGYEIFPRRAPGSTGSPSSSSSGSDSKPARSNIEASPYMDDTGDIENRGRRTPRHRRR